MKAFLKSKDTYLAAKLAYAHCGDEADPPYQPVLILEPGNVQQSKEESHQNWTDVFKEVSSSSRSSLPTRITHSLDFFYFLSPSALSPFSYFP